MNTTLVNTLFMIAAYSLAFFAVYMYAKTDSDESMKTYVYEVPDCRKDVNTVCQRIAVQPIKMMED